MARLTANVAANIVGLAWSALTQLVCLPLYLRFLGAEQFGLIGFFATLQAVALVLDLGIGPTLARELAKRSLDSSELVASRNLLRTVELVYLTLGVVAGSSIIVAAPWISSHWLGSAADRSESIRFAIRLMGVVVGLQWPLSLYQGGLVSLERQLPLNVIKISMTSLAAGGSLFVVARLSATPAAFFSCQAVVFVLYVLATRGALWRSLQSGHRPRWTPSMLRGLWRFSAGMTGLMLTGMVLGQADKIFLSRVTALRTFGFYALASTLCGGLSVLILPLFNGLYPRFSTLAVAGDTGSLRRLYHDGTQYMAALVLPISATISLFGQPLVYLWTGNPEAAAVAGPILSVLIVSTGLNGLIHVPYALEIAHGKTARWFRINLFLIGVIVPLLFVLFHRYGPIGTAAACLIMNVLYVAIGVSLTHRRFLRGESREWFFEDVAPPLLASVGVVMLCRFILPVATTRLAMGAEFAFTIAAAGFSALAATPVTRSRLRSLRRTIALRSE